MRGSLRGRYRGRRPGNPSPRGRLPRAHHEDAVLDSEAFKRATAATDDRQEFDRQMSLPAQSQQTPSQQEAPQQNWRPTKRVSKDEIESIVQRTATLENVDALEPSSDSDSGFDSDCKGPKDTAQLLFVDVCKDEGFPVNPQVRKDFGFEGLESNEDQQQLLGLWHGIFIPLETDVDEVRRWRDEGTLRQNIIQLHENWGTSSRYFTWFKRNKDILPTPAWVAGGYKAKMLGRPSAYTRGVFTGTKVPSDPRKASLDNLSKPLSQPPRSSSAWKSADIDDTSTFMRAVQANTPNGHELGTPSKTADIVGIKSRRYDIATLKRWQPAKGGTTLAIAGRAASQMRSLLPPPDQPLFGRPAVNVELASHAVKGFLHQAQEADHKDARVDVDVRGTAIPHSTIPTRTQELGLANATDEQGLFEGNIPQATVRANENVDLLGLDDVMSPELEDEDVAKVFRPCMQIQNSTRNVWKSNRCRDLAQTQSVLLGDGSLTGRREVGPKNGTDSWSGSTNTLVKREAAQDGATELLSAIGYGTTVSNNPCPMQEVIVNESTTAKGDRNKATCTESDDQLKTSSREKENSAGAQGKGSTTTTPEPQTTRSVPEKDIIVREESKEGAINDPFKWLLPANFR